MAWNFTADKPIFQQIIDRLQQDIVCERFVAGEKLPTVRDFAMETGVNPNTVQRAYAGMEETGLIFVKRGDGRYVTEDKDLILSKKREYLISVTKEYLRSMKASGQDIKSINDLIKQCEENPKNE